MRKVLLASAAMLGAAAGVGAPAFAQSSSTMQPAVAGPQPLQGQVAAPWFAGASYNNQNNSLAQVKTYQGNVIGLGFDSAPLPGTVVIHLHGRIEFDAQAEYSTGNNLSAGTKSSGSSVAGGATVLPGAKLNPVSFGSYMRLYPGVDGMATNGLRYGAQIELRENFASTGSDPYPSQNAALSPGGSKSAQTVFVNRSYIYVSADNIGMVRFGQADGVIGLFDPCIFSGACWDAGVGVFQGVTGGLGPATNVGLAGSYFTLAQNSADYGNVKATYLSPQLFGFELGVQFAPNQGNGFSTCATPQSVLSATTGAVGTASGCVDTTSGNEPTRWYNQVGFGLRYQGIFGPVSVGAYGFYEHAAIEKVPTQAPLNGTATAKAGAGLYDPLNWYEVAVYGRLATGVGTFTASADYVGGAISSGTLLPRPVGGVSESGFQPGLMYNNGPFTVGALAMLLTSQGSAALVGISQRNEEGLAIGGNYNIAPGLFLAVEYQHETRHQGGFNFTTNATGATVDARSNTYLVAVDVNW
jgi:hypothetical protein